jgi:hypothetical protein
VENLPLIMILKPKTWKIEREHTYCHWIKVTFIAMAIKSTPVN